MKRRRSFEVMFFPIVPLEDYLSEKTLWVEAEDEKSAKEKAQEKINAEDRVGNYRREDPMVLKVASLKK